MLCRLFKFIDIKLTKLITSGEIENTARVPEMEGFALLWRSEKLSDLKNAGTTNSTKPDTHAKIPEVQETMINAIHTIL